MQTMHEAERMLWTGVALGCLPQAQVHTSRSKHKLAEVDGLAMLAGLVVAGTRLQS
jgi:hypothetical protein